MLEVVDDAVLLDPVVVGQGEHRQRQRGVGLDRVVRGDEARDQADQVPEQDEHPQRADQREEAARVALAHRALDEPVDALGGHLEEVAQVHAARRHHTTVGRRQAAAEGQRAPDAEADDEERGQDVDERELAVREHHDVPLAAERVLRGRVEVAPPGEAVQVVEPGSVLTHGSARSVPGLKGSGGTPTG